MIVNPWIESQVSSGAAKVGDILTPSSILDLFNFENIQELKTYANCFNESLRMEPPVSFSSSNEMLDDVVAGGFKIRKGDPFLIMMQYLANDPKEWIEPERFIPERFEVNSPYYLTPSGKKRNPFSFSPFLGGQRVCLGKTFAETISKLTVTTLLSTFDFHFLDGVDP